MTASFDGWDELIAGFRALGGAFDNIVVRSEDGNRGLFPIDPQRESRIHVPRSLFIPSDGVRVEDGALKLAPDAPASDDARAFFEAYHRFTSWSGGGRAREEDFFRSLHSLPEGAKTMLSKQLDLGAWFEPLSDELVMRQFVKARLFNDAGRHALAPMLELTNHDPRGPKLEVGADGLTLRGRFPGQIAWRYRTADTYQMFRTYRFASEERFAFSLPFAVTDKRLGLAIHVTADIDKRQSATAPIPEPIVTRKDNRIDVAFIVLADRANGRVPLTSFKNALGAYLGKGTLEFFEGLLFYNRQKFFELMAAVEDSSEPAAQLIRKVCRLQLETLNMVSFQ